MEAWKIAVLLLVVCVPGAALVWLSIAIVLACDKTLDEYRSELRGYEQDLEDYARDLDDWKREARTGTQPAPSNR